MSKKTLRQGWHFSNRIPELILLTLILLSNTAIVAAWYFDQPEEIRFLKIAGLEIAVVKGAVTGHLDKIVLKDDGRLELHGWAFDPSNSRLPDNILVMYDRERIYDGKTNTNRDGVVKLYGVKALRAGFRFYVPAGVFKDKKIDNSKLRLFAVSNGLASELKYPRGFK